jgi:hypothetical protein
VSDARRTGIYSAARAGVTGPWSQPSGNDPSCKKQRHASPSTINSNGSTMTAVIVAMAIIMITAIVVFALFP